MTGYGLRGRVGGRGTWRVTGRGDGGKPDYGEKGEEKRGKGEREDVLGKWLWAGWPLATFCFTVCILYLNDIT